jgi:CheY-like chemotaxis protein
VSTPERIRVLVADDQKVIRDGLALMLSLLDGIEVVGTAVDGADAVRQTLAADPDVVLMDLHMPTLDGVAAIRRLAERGARARVVVLTTYADDESVFPALQARPTSTTCWPRPGAATAQVWSATPTAPAASRTVDLLHPWVEEGAGAGSTCGPTTPAPIRTTLRVDPSAGRSAPPGSHEGENRT